MSKLILKAYPNGDVNVTLRRTFRLEPSEILPTCEEHRRWIRAVLGNFGVEAVIACEKAFRKRQPQAAPLSLSTVTDSHIAKPYCPGLTRLGRRRIECGLAILEREAPVKHLSLLTLTLPPGVIAAAQSKDVCRATDRFKQWLNRRLISAGLPGEIVGVVEPHPNRSADCGEMIPHYHLVFIGRQRGKTWAVTHKEIVEAWQKILLVQVVGCGHVDFSASVDVQAVKKSVRHYLSKYMAKSRAATLNAQERNKMRLAPGSWYICTRSLVRKIEQATRYVEGNRAEVIWNWITKSEFQLARAWGEVFVETPDGEKLWVGAWSKLHSWVDIDALCSATLS